ncbi:MAG: DUF6314 family protein [Pseudomonadota bacterium]
MFAGLNDFIGVWQLSREISHDDASDASFTGHARFIPKQDGLLYHETGQLQIEGQSAVNAERRYFWRPAGQGAIDVFFDDGRAFHRIDPTRPEDTHFCDPDTYIVRYRFSDWPEWQANWRVSGPKKSYRLTSLYKKL